MNENEHDRLVTLETRFEEYRIAMSDRLQKLNELRDAVTTDRDMYLRIDVYTARHEDLRKRIEAVNEASLTRHDTLEKEMRARDESNYSALSERISPLASAVSRLTGVGATLIVLAGILGALVGHFWH